MARRKKNMSIDEQRDLIQKEITSLKEQLATKEEELNSLNERKAEEERQNLIEAIYSSGKSYEDIMAFLNNDGYEDENDNEGDESNENA